jgi:hypothetical protein
MFANRPDAELVLNFSLIVGFAILAGSACDGSKPSCNGPRRRWHHHHIIHKDGVVTVTVKAKLFLIEGRTSVVLFNFYANEGIGISGATVGM